jgi:two-component system chemotaxis sensor kinase CheA
VLNYVNIRTGTRKIFHCGFASVERAHGEIFVLVTIYDITAKVELQQRLLEEENRRQEEMRSIFELVQVEPMVFSDFLEDAGYEFSHINKILDTPGLSTHEVLVDIYQSVHAIKSNAVTLGLKTFGNKVHNLESEIKKLREQEETVPNENMLQLTEDIEKLVQEQEMFKTTLDKIKSFKIGKAGQNQYEYVLVESLTKTTEKVAADLQKKAVFVVDGIDVEALEKGPRRIIKELLMQLVRNSVVHGIEAPEERVVKKKHETGTIHLSIQIETGKIHIKLQDDGRGLDFDKIREKAEHLHLIRKEDGNNKNLLLKAIFSPGFSTAETEGIHAGRGIGLNLVWDRVQEVHGSMKVHTERGKGLIFNIYIPIESNTAIAQNAE